MLVLTALAACICLVVLVSTMLSVGEAMVMERPSLTRDVVDDAKWVQDAGLQDAACRVSGQHPWEQRQLAAAEFEGWADHTTSSLRDNLLAHGVSYTFSYNVTLATMYLAGGSLPGAESIDGVLVKNDRSTTKVCGCGYDIHLMDGSAKYWISSVIAWA